MFRPGMLVFVGTYYLLAGLGVNLGYHRVLSHRSLRVPKWLERTLVALGLPAGTPVQWPGNHRFHHAHTDTPEDPHSPIHHGFWYAHVGWYIGSRNVVLCILYSLAGPFRMLLDAFMRPRSNQQFNYLAQDVSSDSWYAWSSRPWPYAVLMLPHVLIPGFIAWKLWGLAGIALFWITLTALYNIGDAIDSVSHLLGDRLENQGDGSRNSLAMGLLILGEGWHANHHRFPWSAKHGIRSGQFDWTWQIICFLRRVGLAHDIRIATEADLNSTRTNRT